MVVCRSCLLPFSEELKHILPFHSSNTVPVLQNCSKITVSGSAVSSAQSLEYHSSQPRNLNSTGATKCSPYNPLTWLGFQSPFANVYGLCRLSWKEIIPSGGESGGKMKPNLDRALTIVPLPEDMKFPEPGGRLYLPRGLKGPCRGRQPSPHHTTHPPSTKLPQRWNWEERKSPASLSSQRMTVSLLIVDIMGMGTKASSAPQGAVPLSHSWVCMGTGGGGGAVHIS